MNIFEGARRITKICCAIILVTGAAVSYWEPGNARVDYRVVFDGPVLSSDRCDWKTDAIEYDDRQTKSGKPYRIAFCFPALKAQDGRLLIPYYRDEKGTYLNEKFSEPVMAYTKRFVHEFEPNAQQEQEAEDAYFTAAKTKYGHIAFGTVVSAILFWWLSKLVGWVIRGFMGIPSGHDQKPSATDQQAA